MNDLVLTIISGASLVAFDLTFASLTGSLRNSLFWLTSVITLPVLAMAWTLVGSRITAGGCAIAAVFAAWMWWRSDGGGRARRAAKELGAKSKARVEALVRRMTPSPIPSPVGGAS